MTPFIRVTELWLPSGDRSKLVFGGGLYGPLEDFRAVSERTTFAYGEGLPGKAWSERRPIILKQLSGSYFRRGAEAEAAGLTCGVALPVFAGDILLAVVVFFCGGDYEHVGAIELWMNEPGRSGQISFVDGYHGTAELFERGAGTSYGRGYGLPGLTWAAGVPVFLTELHRSDRLLRREDKVPVGVSTGIGIPLLHDADRSWVLTFLSASGTPIARRFKVWMASPDRSHLVRTLDPGEDEGAYKSLKIARDDGAFGGMLTTGVPLVTTSLAADSPLSDQAIADEGYTCMVAIPILSHDARVIAVTAWYW